MCVETDTKRNMMIEVLLHLWNRGNQVPGKLQIRVGCTR